LSHETLHAVLATDDPMDSQLGMNARAAIDVPSLIIGQADLLNQSLIL